MKTRYLFSHVTRPFHRVVHSLLDGQLPEFGFLGIQPEEPPVGSDSSESVHKLKGARIKTWYEACR